MATDKFDARVRRAVALRAGHICSNPSCRRPTAGPHSDPQKSLITGEACHIRAASENGPRYDAAQTSEERRDIRNAIWLCAVYSDRVDKDWQSRPADVLLRWKAEHEHWVGNEGMIPALPVITLSTHSGLALNPGIPVAADDIARLRQQDLTLHNPNRVELHNLQFTIRLPEFAVAQRISKSFAGCQWKAGPEIGSLTVRTLGQGASVRPKGLSGSPNVRLEVASLPAGVTFAITLLTTNDEEGPGTGLAQMLDAVPDALCWLIEGHFQFELRGEFVTTEILVPLDYAPEVRRLSSQPCERDDGSRRVIQNTFYSGFSLKGIGFVHG